MLRAQGVAARRARILEASISGMFVELPDSPFCCNCVLAVEMTLPGDAGLRTYCWQAMVIRKTDAGMGLMFDRLRPLAITRLMESVAAGLPLPAHSAPANVVSLRRAADKSHAL